MAKMEYTTEETIKAIAMIKLTFPQNASYSFLLPAQQQAPMTHKGGQNLIKIKGKVIMTNTLFVC
jgi:hypothetical protein